MPALDRDIARRLAVARLYRRIRAVVQEERDDREIAGERRGVERRSALQALRVRIGAGVEEHVDRFQVAGACVGRDGRVQWGEMLIAGSRPRIRAGVEEIPDDLAMLEERGEPQRGE